MIMRVLYRTAIPEIVLIDRRGDSMSPEITIVDSTPEHVGALKSNLRAEDANEILRFGVTIQQALWRSYRDSIIRKSIFVDGKIAAMYGCSGVLLGNTGVIWLLTTNEVNKVSPLRFARIYQEQVQKTLKIFPTLFNYVDASYRGAIRLLENTGFIVYDAEKLGDNGALFRRFEIQK